MDFYVIPPNSSLDLMHHGRGEKYFCLAHLYIQHEHYRKFFKARKADGCFITLDNSAAERSLVTEDVLIDCVKDLMPNEVIAPDVLFDKQATLTNLTNFIWRMHKESLLGKVNVFGCPQGKTKPEWLECYNEMLQTGEVEVIGLSKIAVPMAFGGKIDDQGIKEGRHECIDYLLYHNLLKKPVHLLGAGDPTEFEAYGKTTSERIKMIRSTDSCFSVWAAMNGIRWIEGNYTRIKTPHNYFDRDLSLRGYELAIENIQYLHDNIPE